jgi:PIN domain nuclease of toxin-antitoxin system
MGYLMVLLDTCALLWWTLQPEKLSKKAQNICSQIPEQGAFISSISIWEIGIKMKKGTLNINESLPGYMKRLKQLGSLEIIAVDENVWVENIELNWEHRDPADRTIVATAKLQNLPIMTKDLIIRNYYEKIIW